MFLKDSDIQHTAKRYEYLQYGVVNVTGTEEAKKL